MICDISQEALRLNRFDFVQCLCVYVCMALFVHGSVSSDKDDPRHAKFCLLFSFVGCVTVHILSFSISACTIAHKFNSYCTSWPVIILYLHTAG